MFINIHTHKASANSLEIENHDFFNNTSGFFSIGVHPWKSSNPEVYSMLQKTKELAFLKQCLAIGEIGLDKLKGAPLETQLDLFEQQILLSEKLKLPVIIHCVKAWNEIAFIKNKLMPVQTWIFHGFSKTSLVTSVLDNNVKISIGKEVLSHKKLQETVKLIPLDSLFLETDDSDASILSIYEKVSSLKNIPLSVLENQIESNFKRVFTKWTTG
jgi:TatD DNase family protein